MLNYILVQFFFVSRNMPAISILFYFPHDTLLGVGASISIHLKENLQRCQRGEKEDKIL